jgi:hypothetical protein
MCLHFILYNIVKKKGDIKKSENKNWNIMKFSGDLFRLCY